MQPYSHLERATIVHTKNASGRWWCMQLGGDVCSCSIAATLCRKMGIRYGSWKRLRYDNLVDVNVAMVILNTYLGLYLGR